MKSKMPLFLIVAGGYIFSIVVYLIWHYTIWPYSPNDKNIIVVVVGITALYLFLYFLISSIKSFQRPWKSFFFVSTITLLTVGLIPSAYYAGYEFIKANNKIKKEKIRLKKLKAQINDANKSIAELIAKLEYERKENDNLREQLNEIIKKTESDKRGNNTKGDIVVQKKSNKEFSTIKTNSELSNTDEVIKNQEITFKVQIISSDTRLSIDSPQFKGLKNIWEYKDRGLYKYTVGNQIDLKSATKIQSEFRRKGFNGAFVVAFKNGKRIPVKEVLKSFK